MNKLSHRVLASLISKRLKNLSKFSSKSTLSHLRKILMTRFKIFQKN